MSGDGMGNKGDTPRLKLPAQSPDYGIGYARPPAEHRFRKGTSGNPRGRPKGAKNKRPALHEERLKGLILDEAYRGIDIREGERTLTVPMAQAVLRAIAHSAVKGKHFSQRLFTQLVNEVESANFALNGRWFETAVDYKHQWEQELDRRRRHDIRDLPDPLPHPDHIVLDMQTGTARILGPSTREELAAFRHYAELWVEYCVDLPVYEAHLRRMRSPTQKAELAEAVAKIRRTWELLDKTLPQDMKEAAKARMDKAIREE